MDTGPMTKTVTRRPTQRASELDHPPPVLRLVYGPALGVVRDQVFPLLVGNNSLGREPQDPNGIAIPKDGLLSREHVIIAVKTASPGGYRLLVRDLDSKNGTFVNQSSVKGEAVPLQLGDVLRVGDSFLVVTVEPTEDAVIPSLIGDSAEAAALRSRLLRLAPSKATVLLLGETGTGKEVAARALHHHSRRTGAFIAVNCGAVPKGLAESQFFGQLYGAYSGAIKLPGFFRAAHLGTLFLDEAGDLPAEVQVKLLRALEERAVTPVGGTQAEPCDVRVIAATNDDLLRSMAAGRFREDLYARLNDEIVRLPPLRARREDILPLVLSGHERGDGGVRLDLNAELVDALLHYGYPFNVRELVKIAQHLSRFGADEALWQRLRPAQPDASLPTPKSVPPEPPAPREPLVPPPRGELEERLKERKGVLQYVAEDCHCSVRTLSRWIKGYGIDVSAFRPARNYLFDGQV